MRVLLCDDDRQLRSVLATLLVERGHEIVAEADMAMSAIELLDRLLPDLAIVDLSLPFGSGSAVIDAALARQCAVIVFSSFEASCPGAAAVVQKPDFAKLEAAVDAVATRVVQLARDPRAPDRRRSHARRSHPEPSAQIDAPEEFYRALAEAQPDDAILRMSHEPSGAHLATTARTVLRAQDHVAQIGSEVFALLVTGGAEGVAAVIGRLSGALPSASRDSLECHHAVIGATDTPAEVFTQLRRRDRDPTPSATP